jgi:lysozyme
MLYGLDIASYQGLPDFARLRTEGHDFMITKATGEGQYVNPYWSQNRDNARAAGLIVGTYDWVEPQGAQTGADAALDYLRVVDSAGGRLPGELLCVDFETPAWASGPLGAAIEPWMREYLYALRDKGGQPVIVYTAPYFLAETGAARWDWLGRDFLYWIAAPGPRAMLPDDAPWPGGALVAPWPEALIHQHQWHATSGAVAGEFDRDRFGGTRAGLAAHGLPGAVPVPPTPQEGDVREPATDHFTAYINDNGETIFAWNAGGQTRRIDGINVQDLGVSVESATEPGVILDRSIQANVVQVWHDRRPDAGATEG